MGGGGGRGVLGFGFCGCFFFCWTGKGLGVLFVAIVSTDGSEIVWEPGSAMVPTFCADGPKPRKSSPEDAALGKAKAGDGDLPLAEGEGGGDPNRESPSSMNKNNSFLKLCNSVSGVPLVFGCVLPVVVEND